MIDTSVAAFYFSEHGCDDDDDEFSSGTSSMRGCHDVRFSLNKT